VGAHFPPWKNGSRTLADLGLVQGKVVSVSPEDSILDALHRMQQAVISSIAIVKDGQLLGSISMTDIKEVFGPHGRWMHVYDTCAAFFARIRSKQGIENAGRDKVPLFTCTADMTLIDAAEKMAGVRAHRLWILASPESSSPVAGVLSLSDVVPLMLQ
jgi:CBS domain-containing protein